MMQTKSPTWAINFTRKDLVAAAWGSSKGADLLYHFIHKASREIENRNLPETLKDIPFQEPQKKIQELVPISVGSLHTYLKYFVAVGYVSNKAYSKDFVVHLGAIEKAFTEIPPKPEEENSSEKKDRKPRQNVSKNETLKLVTLPLEELDRLYDKIFQVKEMFQQLNEKYSELETKFTKLSTLKSSEQASEADITAISDSLYDSVCLGDDSEFTSAAFVQEDTHLCDCANASSLLRLLPYGDLDPLAEDEVQPQLRQKKQAEQTNNSYSQQPEQPQQETLFGDSIGYEKEGEPAPQGETEKPKRTRKREPQIELTTEQLEHCRRWYAYFEKWRGEKFETKGDKINAGKYIKKLVLKYDETTIMRIFKHLTEKHFKWSKPSYKFKIIPYVVYTEAHSVLQQWANPEADTGQKPANTTPGISTLEKLKADQKRYERIAK